MTNNEAIRILSNDYEVRGLHNKALEAIDLAIDAMEHDRWISVEERLPEAGTDVLVCLRPPFNKCQLSWLIGNGGSLDDAIYPDFLGSDVDLSPIGDRSQRQLRRSTMLERTCSTCNAEYCMYANKAPSGKPQYDFRKLFDCRNHRYLMWKEKIIQEPPKEE